MNKIIKSLFATRWEGSGESIDSQCLNIIYFIVSQQMQKETFHESLMDNFNKTLREYAMHSFRFTHQLSFHKLLIEQLPSQECIIHIDFSENYQGKRYSEIQSFHFGGSHPQIVIQQGMYYLITLK